MPIVVDVSAIVPLAFPDEDHTLAEAVIHKLASEGGLVPALFWFEVWNTLAMNERRDRSTLENTEHFVSLLARLNLAIDPLPEAQKILALTRRHGITAYDAAYLELALRAGLPLATGDKELINAMGAAGGKLFGTTKQ